MADVALLGCGEIRLDGLPRANAQPNPAAGMGLYGWVTDSYEVLTRETSAAVTIPNHAAFSLAAVSGGCYLQGDTVPLPDGVTYGEYVNVQAAIYVEGVTDETAAIQFNIVWRDEDDVGLAAPDWGPDVVNEAFWASEFDRELVDFPLPLSGFTVASGNFLVPSALSTGGKHATQFFIFIMVGDATGEDPWEGADDAILYATNVLVEAATEDAEVIAYSESTAKLDNTVYWDASGTLELSGSAWLSHLSEYGDTLQASGIITLRGAARRLSSYTVADIATSSVANPTVITTSVPHGLGAIDSTVLLTIIDHSGSTPAIDGDYTATITGISTFTIPVTVTVAGTGGTANHPDRYSGASLPETDDLGWTTPDAGTPDIQGLAVLASGIPISPAQITDLIIELDNEGGAKAATMSVNCALERAPTAGTDTLLVTYKGQTLFTGRLENIEGDVSSSTGYTLTYGGPVAALKDNKSFRATYVDSDLDNWRTDQGPMTSPDTYVTLEAGD